MEPVHYVAITTLAFVAWVGSGCWSGWVYWRDADDALEYLGTGLVLALVWPLVLAIGVFSLGCKLFGHGRLGRR